MTNALKVYYLASGRLGIPSLHRLIADPRIELIGIGTQPDRPAGRRRTLQGTPFAEYCRKHNIAVETITSVNNERFADDLAAEEPDLLVVAAFGQILKPHILDLPKYGCLNLHASLLPKHRGAAPIAAAILAGDPTTGISFMQMDPGLDTGAVYRTAVTPIGEQDTTWTLEGRLAELAAEGIGSVTWDICREGLQPIPQDNACSTYAPKLKKEDGCLDWQESASLLARRIRAYIPWPKAFTKIPGARRAVRIQITEATIGKDISDSAAGTVLGSSSDGILVGCGDGGTLCLRKLIPEGKREMDAHEFLRGTPVAEGVRLFS